MADDTNTAERASFEAHYRRCGATDETLSRWVDDGSTPPAMVGKYIIRSVQDAWLAFQAGRASLAASAGSEPVAWLVPHLHTFKGATKVHFTRAPGCTMTDAELMDDLEGRVMWLPSTFSDSPGVTDKFGVHHKPKPLYTHPSPPEGMAGWISLSEQQPEDGVLKLFCNMKAESLAATFFVDWMVGGKFCGNRHNSATHYQELPPLPASAKEL